MILLKLILILLFSKCVINFTEYDDEMNEVKSPSPLVLVPGDGGSTAYSYVDYYLFTLKRLLWVNYEYMIFPGFLSNLFKLIYDPKTHTTKDAPHSKVFFPGWGSTETIETLDEWNHMYTTYFAPLVKELIKDKFYVRNTTLRGAPFDFRKAPNENLFFVNDLKILIEETYTLAGNKRVVLLGHSLGTLYSMFFLNKMTNAWKKRYVRTFVLVSGPLGGAVKATKLEAIGDSLGSPRCPYYFREMERSFPSTAFLLPRYSVFGDMPIIITPQKNYSAKNNEELFNDMKVPYGSMMYNDTVNLVDGSISPEGIDELYCIHGTDQATAEQLIFTDFPDKPPKIVYGDGDTTVNIQSLMVCKKWPNIKYRTIAGGDHMHIVGDQKFITMLKEILYDQSKSECSPPVL